MTEKTKTAQTIDDATLDAAAGGANTYGGTTTVNQGILNATAGAGAGPHVKVFSGRDGASTTDGTHTLKGATIKQN